MYGAEVGNENIFFAGLVMLVEMAFPIILIMIIATLVYSYEERRHKKD